MKKLFILLPIFLMACTSTTAPTAPSHAPAQDIYLAESDYAAALRIELAYSKLPRCGKTSPTLCSDAATIRKVQKVDDSAWIALQDAQAAVRTPGFSTSKVTMAYTSATALTKAFLEITQSLGVK